MNRVVIAFLFLTIGTVVSYYDIDDGGDIHRDERISIHDTPSEIFAKLTEGDRGAYMVLQLFMDYADKHDPSGLGGYLSLLHFDRENIRGEAIKQLLVDTCKGSMKCVYDRVSHRGGEY